MLRTIEQHRMAPAARVRRGQRSRPYYKLWPIGAILHWDADIDAFSEQTGGPHTFNHAVLAPQYQRNADGSYANVGAKPAVDVYDGEKWLRSCGAVTNLLPSGAENISSSFWSKTRAVVSGSVITATEENGYISLSLSSMPIGTYTFSVRLLDPMNSGGIGLTILHSAGVWSVAGTTKFSDNTYYLTFTNTVIGQVSVYIAGQSTLNTGESVSVADPQLTATAHPVPYTPPGTTMPASNATTTNGSWFSLPDGSPLWQALEGKPDGVELVTNGTFDADIVGWSVGNAGASTLSWAGGRIRITRAQVGDNYPNARYVLSGLTVGARYLIVSKTSNPYGIETYHSIAGISASLVKITSPIAELRSKFVATNTTHNLDVGIWSTSGSLGQYVEFDNISIQRIQPQPLTLATRVRMGVGSGDFVGSLNLLSAQTAVAGGLGPQYYADSGVVVKAFDGTASVFLGCAFARNAIIRRVTQVNTAGTQYRVGYMVEGTHTTIQWGSWVSFDGSFNPSTLYRLMLGYNNAYPMWFNKITAWKEQVTDAEILEAMA